MSGCSWMWTSRLSHMSIPRYRGPLLYFVRFGLSTFSFTFMSPRVLLCRLGLWFSASLLCLYIKQASCTFLRTSIRCTLHVLCSLLVLISPMRFLVHMRSSLFWSGWYFFTMVAGPESVKKLPYSRIGTIACLYSVTASDWLR